MSDHKPSTSSYNIVKQKKKSHLDSIPDPDPSWPYEVQAVYESIKGRLYDTELTIKDILSEKGIKNKNLYTIFKYYVGETPRKWIINHRLKVASEILSETDISITTLAISIGYDKPSSFSKIFKQRKGVTPKKY